MVLERKLCVYVCEVDLRTYASTKPSRRAQVLAYFVGWASLSLYHFTKGQDAFNTDTIMNTSMDVNQDALFFLDLSSKAGNIQTVVTNVIITFMFGE